MHKYIIWPIILFLFSGCAQKVRFEPQNGDIIFQISRSAQSLAIQRATGSKYSHMGIIYIKDGKPYVFEAVEPVKMTPMEEWISRGVDSAYVVKRIIGADTVLTPETLKVMLEIGETFIGKHYDPLFEWSDERMYCSELVWKIYKRSMNLEIGKLQKLSDFNLSDPIVQIRVRKRYGTILPEEETVISPGEMYNSDVLITVASVGCSQ
ncbi:YiiX family permuted papain-like enzyme [bacterium]|nr:YiiX family permuted papain-like enzyme [bacterium]